MAQNIYQDIKILKYTHYAIEDTTSVKSYEMNR